MELMYKPRVKICCISSIAEAHLAVKYGASAIGLVSAMPSGPGPIPEELIAEIAAAVPSGVETFFLTSKQSAHEVIVQQKRTQVTTIQLVDRFPISEYNIMRGELPRIRIIQVIHVTDDSAVKEASAVVPYVDGLLLDSGNPALAVKELGGTGRVHNWSISKQICEAVDIPVFLAGGLKPENVREAIGIVRPYGVDVCSGVRTNGGLDEKKLADFFAAVRNFN